MNAVRDDLYETSCPVIRRDVMQLSAWFSQPGGASRLIPFEREIVWVRESEAQILAMHGGECINEFSTYSDFYGYLTSIDGALEDVDGVMKTYKVTAASTLSFEVVVRVFDAPFLPSSENAVFRGRTAYEQITGTWFIRDDELEDSIRAAARAGRHEDRCDLAMKRQRIERRLVKESVVWNSQSAKAENKAAIEAFVESVAVTPEAGGVE